MKSRVTLLLSVVACGLVLAGTALGGSPDFLQFFCVDESDRTNVVAARDDCDVLATGAGYRAGVLQPCIDLITPDSPLSCGVLCLGTLVVYQCGGVPGTQG